MRYFLLLKLSFFYNSFRLSFRVNFYRTWLVDFSTFICKYVEWYQVQSCSSFLTKYIPGTQVHTVQGVHVLPGGTPVHYIIQVQVKCNNIIVSSIIYLSLCSLLFTYIAVYISCPQQHPPHPPHHHLHQNPRKVQSTPITMDT